MIREPEPIERDRDLCGDPRSQVYIITDRCHFPTVGYPDLDAPMIQIYQIPVDVSPDGKLPDLVTGMPLPTRETVRYADRSYRGTDELGEVLSDLWCTNTEDIHDPDLKAAFRLFLNPHNVKAWLEVIDTAVRDIEEIVAYLGGENQQKNAKTSLKTQKPWYKCMNLSQWSELVTSLGERISVLLHE